MAKLTGIDAFVADWYGPDASAEHPYDNIGFTAMRKAAEKLNFKVMICWEDRSMFPPISPAVKNRTEAISRGKEIIKYLQKEWFSSKAYLKIENRPVLTNFAWGAPGKDINEPWLSAVEWNTVLDSLSPRPVFIHDWQRHRAVNDFNGYESVMPWGSAYHGGDDTAPVFWENAENALKEYKGFLFLSGTVLPGFDNRGCGGWGSDGAIGFTNRRNGNKFRATWEDCLKHNPKFIQIVTWNDLNEGGTIEPVKPLVLHQQSPAEGYGYRELETTAQYAGKLKNCKFDKESLRLPGRLYFARKKIKNLEVKNSSNLSIESLVKMADETRDFLLSGDIKSAESMLKKLDEYLAGEL